MVNTYCTWLRRRWHREIADGGTPATTGRNAPRPATRLTTSWRLTRWDGHCSR